MVEPWAAFTAERLMAASLQGGLVVALVWLACRWRRSLSPGLQAALWWVASLKLIVALAPMAAVPLPVLPAAFAPDAPPRSAPGVVAAPSDPAIEAAPGPVVDLAPPAGEGPASVATTGLVLLTGFWLSGVVIGLAGLVASVRCLRGLVRRSRPAGAEVAALVASRAAALGLRRVPRVRVSDEAGPPQVAGVWRPVVVLPASMSAWNPDDLRMIVAHELVHVRQRDLLLGWIPAAAERLFFFHPLARLAAREYLVAREAACDAAVLRLAGVEPAAYGRLLVRMGVTGVEPVAGAAASATASGLRRRLEMLTQMTRGSAETRRRWILVIAAALLLLPIQFVARAAPAAGAGPPIQEWSRSAVERSVESSGMRSAGPMASHEARAPMASLLPQGGSGGRDGLAEGNPAPDRASTQSPSTADADAERRRDAERRALDEVREALRAARAAREQTDAAGRARGDAEAIQEEALSRLRALAAERNRVAGEARDRYERALREYEATLRSASVPAGSVRAAYEDALREYEAALGAAAAAFGPEQAAPGEAQRRMDAELQRLRERLREGDAADARTQVPDRLVQQLAQQLEAMRNAQETLARQQQALLDAQRRLSEQLEALRQSLERMKSDAPPEASKTRLRVVPF